MYKTAFLLPVCLLVFLLTGCDKDPYALELDRFDVRWYDDDHSGTQTPGDALEFDVRMITTAPNENRQHIERWEFSYAVNGEFVGVLQGDNNLRVNEVNLDAEVYIDDLLLPFPGSLLPGDVIEFRIWARDDQGVEVEQHHRFVLE